MQTSIEYEKKVLNNVIDEFNLKKNFYLNLIRKYGIVDGFVGRYMLKSSEKVGGHDIIWYGSHYFFGLIDSNFLMSEVRFNGLLKKIFREVRGVLVYGLKLESKSEYIDKLLDHFYGGCLDFIKLIGKYKLGEKYFIEYYFACFKSLMLTGLGEINNFKLYDLIVRIWVLMDNMVDSGEHRKWVGEVCYFFENRLWRDKEIRIGFLGKEGNPLLECFLKMEGLLEEQELVRMYNRFWKLYKFDYRGKKVENIFKYSCLKTRKSMDIFMFAMNVNKNEIDICKYYNIALLIQLFDNLIDIKKDIIEGNNNIFLRGDKEENTGTVIVMMENYRLYFGESAVFFEVGIMMSVLNNEKYFMTELVDGYKRECKFMDLEQFNMEKIYNLLKNTNKMEKLIKIYLK